MGVSRCEEGQCPLIAHERHDPYKIGAKVEMYLLVGLDLFLMAEQYKLVLVIDQLRVAISFIHYPLISTLCNFQPKDCHTHHY